MGQKTADSKYWLWFSKGIGNTLAPETRLRNIMLIEYKIREQVTTRLIC